MWRAYLEGTVQATQSRISACENYKVQVADPAKTVRLQKEQQLRKVKKNKKRLCSGERKGLNLLEGPTSKFGNRMLTCVVFLKFLEMI